MKTKLIEKLWPVICLATTLTACPNLKVTKKVGFQFMENDLLNKEYSCRPMAVAASRTFLAKVDVTF